MCIQGIWQRWPKCNIGLLAVKYMYYVSGRDRQPFWCFKNVIFNGGDEGEPVRIALPFCDGECLPPPPPQCNFQWERWGGTCKDSTTFLWWWMPPLPPHFLLLYLFVSLLQACDFSTFSCKRFTDSSHTHKHNTGDFFLSCVTFDLTLENFTFNFWLDLRKFYLRLDLRNLVCILTWLEKKITWLQHCQRETLAR